MLTFNPAVSKGASSEVTLNKTALASLVSGDDYFADSSNWEKVVVVYESNSNNQKEILSFDASEASPTASFLISDKSDGDFLIDKVIIRDFDYGSFVIGRSSLEGLSLDVVIASGELSVKLDLQSYNNSLILSESGNTALINPGYYNGQYYAAQTFLAEENFSLSKLDFHAYSNDTLTSGNIKVAIWNAEYAFQTGGARYVPIATDINTNLNSFDESISSVETLSVVGTTASEADNATAKANSYEWNEQSPTMTTVEFSTPAELVAGQAYAVVFLAENLVAQDGGTPNYFIVEGGNHKIDYGEGIYDSNLDKNLINEELMSGYLSTNGTQGANNQFSHTPGNWYQRGYDMIIRLSGS